VAHQRRFPGTRRTSQWVGLGVAAGTISSGTTLIASFNAGILALRPFTIVRTHLEISLSSDQTVASEGTMGAFSMQVVTDSASAAGVASVPTPLTQPSADFFVYKPLVFEIIVATAVGFEEHRGDQQLFHIDSKAMRKVGADDDMVMVYEQRVSTGAVIAMEGRMLLKLH